ncbi:MAG: hypothetical protein ABSG70_11525 [Terriglobales bacterium]|jgi:hypothetical protein
MDDLLDALARLDARLENLERRVSALDHLAQPVRSLPVPVLFPAKETAAVEEFALPPQGSVFPVVGKAMLGIAGAYVLRAVAESGSFPKLAVVVLALAYAGTWLAWAARAAARFASTAYAVTAALILAPMLGELTLRFEVLPGLATAGVLSAFVIAAFGLAWKRKLTPMVWVVEAVAAFTAFGLLMVSHDLAPYIGALLVMAAVSETAAVQGRWLGLRFLMAPVLDVALLILLYIHSLPESSRPGYTAVSVPALLALPSLAFLIYGASVVGRTVMLRQRINILEIIQAAIAFVLGALGWLWFASGTGRVGLGIFCWALSAACYVAAFVYFDRVEEQRNYHVYSTWSLALVLAGSFLMLSPLLVAVILSAASIVATVVGVRMARLTPEFHGLAYLTAAAFASGLLLYAGRALAGTFPTAPGGIVWMVAVSALLCYFIGGRFEGDRLNQRLLRLLSAVLAISAIATFLVSCLVWLAAIGMNIGASHIAIIRTLIPCALALAVAWSGSRWRRIELVWTAYGILVFVSAKLLFEDLPHGHSGSIAISIFLYAVALIMVPQVARNVRSHEDGAPKS